MFFSRKQNISLAGSTLADRENLSLVSEAGEHMGSQRGSGYIPATIPPVYTSLAQLCGTKRLPVMKGFYQPLLCLGWTVVDTAENLHCLQVYFQT